jgi:hypothetical protein
MKVKFFKLIAMLIVFSCTSKFQNMHIDSDNNYDLHGNCLIVGKIIDKSNNPISNVPLYIKETSIHTQSDINGNFTFSDIEPGKNIIIIRGFGYEVLNLELFCKANHIIIRKIILTPFDLRKGVI